jgi:hypothetical protein
MYVYVLIKMNTHVSIRVSTLFLEKRKARGSKYFFLFFYRGQVFSLAMTDGPHLLALPVIYITEKEGTEGLWAGGWGEPSAPWGPRASSSPPASRPLHAFVRSGFQFPRIFTCFGFGHDRNRGRVGAEYESSPVTVHGPN